MPEVSFPGSRGSRGFLRAAFPRFVTQRGGAIDRQEGMTLPRQVLPSTTYLVTRRCIGRRFLLRPDPSLNNAFLYCLARAADKYGIMVHAVCAMSNHYHLVVTDPVGVLPDCMAWFNRQLAMCVKRLRSWDEVVWEPNKTYSAVVLVGAKEALDKIVYTVLNPVSAVLVPEPARWPGILSTFSLLCAGEMKAKRPPVWFRKSAPEEVSLLLRPPPATPDQGAYRGALKALLESRQRRLRVELARQGKRFVGHRSICATPARAAPQTRKPEFGMNPTFSALTRSAWQAASESLRAFRRAYRTAYEAWRSGVPGIEFPPGTWWLARFAGVSVATAIGKSS